MMLLCELEDCLCGCNLIWCTAKVAMVCKSGLSKWCSVLLWTVNVGVVCNGGLSKLLNCVSVKWLNGCST